MSEWRIITSLKEALKPSADKVAFVTPEYEAEIERCFAIMREKNPGLTDKQLVELAFRGIEK